MTLKLVVRHQDAEGVDVVGARVAGLRRDLRQRGRVTLADAGASRVAARDRLGDPMARLEPAPHRVVQRQTERRRLWRSAPRRSNGNRPTARVSSAAAAFMMSPREVVR